VQVLISCTARVTAGGGGAEDGRSGGGRRADITVSGACASPGELESWSLKTEPMARRSPVNETS
jgi:hypothetical protein